MKRSVMSYIPESKREGIYDAWEDSDGMWISLKKGWIADRSCAQHTIHEDHVKDLMYQIAGIRKVKDGEYEDWAE